MSRVGKKPITLPQGVECQHTGGKAMIKGPKGAFEQPISSLVKLSLADQTITLEPANGSKEARMMWGTLRSILANIVKGVSEGFVKRLEINGVGYRAAVQGSDLVLQLGFSHEVRYPIPEGIAIKCEKPTLLSIEGANAQRVGQVAAEIRAYRKPEPYKGKGVKYEGEYIFRKEGKKK